ncbi:hypothetical protein Q73A0000_09755 [Kaistella flava (ex Peng et al. 2021)]|uniref:Uncharacterized protein n=1 Tax=Kaistella flava (ex Peng et al. 2021) TaxID=2038776 RepID=A0A7M2Y8Q2_9FLAO|nr:hypothetical protein [Kaistella flava (ex Peng et al. 2021)]QOW10638.1 hypothetical protein Q73A0000_09755 [Kaistella flava (ex Peng et al. 2021)]
MKIFLMQRRKDFNFRENILRRKVHLRRIGNAFKTDLQFFCIKAKLTEKRKWFFVLVISTNSTTIDRHNHQVKNFIILGYATCKYLCRLHFSQPLLRPTQHKKGGKTDFPKIEDLLILARKFDLGDFYVKKKANFFQHTFSTNTE